MNSKNLLSFKHNNRHLYYNPNHQAFYKKLNFLRLHLNISNISKSKDRPICFHFILKYFCMKLKHFGMGAIGSFVSYIFHYHHIFFVCRNHYKMANIFQFFQILLHYWILICTFRKIILSIFHIINVFFIYIMYLIS